MADIVLKDRNGNDIVYPGVTSIKLNTVDGGAQSFNACDEVEKTVAPDFSEGDMEVSADEGTLLSKVTIEKPETLLPKNVRNGVEVAGVTGEFIGDTEEVTVELALADGDQTVSPSADGKVISGVTITKPANLVPENIAKDVDIAGVVGTLESGSGGGEDAGSGEYLVRVIDYDGTVLAEKYLDSGEVFTLPEPPTHDRLVFDKWVATDDITDNTVTVSDNDIMVGALYETASGETEICIELNKGTGLTVTFRSGALTGMTSIDWGDGTTSSMLNHIYAGYGSYIITIYGLTAFANGSSSAGSIVSSKTSAYNGTIKNVYLSKKVTSIGNFSFLACASLRGIVIPSSVTNIGQRALAYVYSLRGIVIPNSVTTYGSDAVSYCYSLVNVVLQSGITAIGASTFQYAASITELVIPKGVTTIEMSAFRHLYSLQRISVPDGVINIDAYGLYNFNSIEKIKLPGSITSFGQDVFYGYYSCKILDFTRHTSVPTLGGTLLGSYYNPSTQILVPSALYAEWISATNWSTYAKNIVSV